MKFCRGICCKMLFSIIFGIICTCIWSFKSIKLKTNLNNVMTFIDKKLRFLGLYEEIRYNKISFRNYDLKMYDSTAKGGNAIKDNNAIGKDSNKND